jgi:hypothetical protein
MVFISREFKRMMDMTRAATISGTISHCMNEFLSNQQEKASANTLAGQKLDVGMNYVRKLF